MIFLLFAVLIAAAFFVSSMFLLNYGRQLGLRYLKQGTSNMAGLATVEGAVFALIGLLLAFTISGALQRFDDRRQLVIQEANAASTAHDRLALFGGDLGRDLQNKLKDYVEARIDLYRMPHDYSLTQRTEFFSPEQQDNILNLKNGLWNAVVAACPKTNFPPACAQASPHLPICSKLRACGSELPRSIRLRSSTSCCSVLAWAGRYLPASVWPQPNRAAGFTCSFLPGP